MGGGASGMEEKMAVDFGLAHEAGGEALFSMIFGAAKAYFHSGLTGGEVMDLIPVKPLKDDEEDIRSRHRLRLGPLWDKIKP